MLFQTLDNKRECVGIVTDGELHSEIDDKLHLTHTWDYSEILGDRDIQYAYLYSGGKTLNEACPEHLEGALETCLTRMRGFLRSLSQTGIDLNKNCFFDLVPMEFLLEFCALKDSICQYVFTNYEKPYNYEFLCDLLQVVGKIGTQQLNINLGALTPTEIAETKNRKFIKNIQAKKFSKYCDFDIFGTKTGRLSTHKGSFPALTMHKELRKTIKPTNDFFVEIDYNAAELRVLLALAGKEQPEIDIHEWNVKNVYRGLITREEAKKRIFAWLYNPDSKDYLSSRAYERDSVRQKYSTQGQVTTFWSRVIPSDEFHAMSYIIQSTTSDLFLRQMIKVNNFLQDKKTHIAFPLHDALILDFSAEETNLIPEIIDIFSDTELGRFKVGSSAGKNFFDMKPLTSYNK